MAAKKTKKTPSAPTPAFRAPKRKAATQEEMPEEGGEESAPPPSLGVAPSMLTSTGDIKERNRIFAAAMNKDGRPRVVNASDAPNVYQLRRPTGIMQLDLDLGGGFPAGGLSIISGPDNAGKTWLMYRAMALHQRLYGPYSNILIGLAEGAFDFVRARDVGLVVRVPDEILAEWNQFRYLTHQPPLSAEEITYWKQQIGEVSISRGANGEDLLHTIKEAVAQNLYSIIGVDSFSIVLPEADEDKNVGDTPKRAGNANLLTDFIKKYTPHTSGIFNPNPTTVIGIMQVRANSDKANAPSYMQRSIKDWSVTGAYSVRHGKLIDLTIYDGGKLKKNVGQQQVVYGKTLYWYTEKGKAGTHDNISGQAEFLYPDPSNPVSKLGHDDAWSVIITGMARGIIYEQKGSVDIYHPTTREKCNFGVFPDLAALHWNLQNNFEFELTLRYYILAAAGIQCLYRPLA